MPSPALSWVILTLGDRPAALERAIASIRGTDVEIVVVFNGVPGRPIDGVTVIETEQNVGVPGGREIGLRRSQASVIGFLDDDAALVDPTTTRRIVERFATDPRLGAVSMRIVDETNATNRRHVPRLGSGSSDDSGFVATFLGGASAVRRSAYDAAGGYWPELFYAHEELDLSWRLHESGFRVFYDADLTVEHPATEISRHTEGWYRTGRNRVLIARRNLPLALMIVHPVVWLLIGAVRTPDRATRRSYVAGWRAGWRAGVHRSPVSWSTVWRLTRAGRPPIL